MNHHPPAKDKDKAKTARAPTFAVGDVVQLKSGGPVMTITRTTADVCHCTFYDGAFHNFTAAPATLRHAKAP